uniref:hypothetical protein n=1 Tax=Bacillus sp. DX2.2 TaxID=3073452 RepID=UPI00402ADE3B
MLNYYGNKESLIDKLRKIVRDLSIVEYYDIDNLSAEIQLIDDSKLNLNFTLIEEGPRGMSVKKPFYNVYCIEITNKVEGLSQNLVEILENKYLSYSSYEIEAITDDMPLLKQYGMKYKGKFNDVALIWRDHFVEDSVGLLKTFVNMGLDPNLTLVFDKGDDTLHRKEVWETFKEMGFGVYKLDNAMFNNNTDNTAKILEVKELLNDFIVNAKRINKKIIIMDDGAFITNFFSNNTDKINGIIELTEMGLRRISSSDINIQCPIINAAKSDLKRYITYPEIGSASVLRILQLLGGEKIIGRRILILGYGDAGMNICKKFKSLGANISVVDPDYLKLILAAEEGFNTYDNVTDAIYGEQPFLIIGASGYSSLTEYDISILPNNSYITTVATADLAVLKNEFFNNVEKKVIPRYGTQYFMGAKTFTLLGNGRSVNLFESESIPNRSIDLFKASILLSAILLIEDRFNLEFGLNKNILNQWLENNGIFRDYYNLYYKKELEHGRTQKYNSPMEVSN